MSNRLIRDDDDVQPASPPAAPDIRRMIDDSVPKPRTGGPYPGRRKVTAHIDRQLFLWLKSMSAQTDKPMILLMEEALTEYVQRWQASRKFAAGQAEQG